MIKDKPVWFNELKELVDDNCSPSAIFELENKYRNLGEDISYIWLYAAQFTVAGTDCSGCINAGSIICHSCTRFMHLTDNYILGPVKLDEE